MIHVDVQFASCASNLPSSDDFRSWVGAAIRRDCAEVSIRVVDRDEGAELNERYRGKVGPTNVLSFPFVAPPGVPSDLLGDIVICAPLVAEESLDQGKAERAHWAHLTVHGVLHLQGFDHIEETEAERMEAEEAAIMARLGFPNPYTEVQNS